MNIQPFHNNTHTREITPTVATEAINLTVIPAIQTEHLTVNLEHHQQEQGKLPTNLSPKLNSEAIDQFNGTRRLYSNKLL